MLGAQKEARRPQACELALNQLGLAVSLGKALLRITRHEHLTAARWF
jgi:hypothetical protein